MGELLVDKHSECRGQLAAENATADPNEERSLGCSDKSNCKRTSGYEPQVANQKLAVGRFFPQASEGGQGTAQGAEAGRQGSHAA